jgi:hypothetical protein
MPLDESAVCIVLEQLVLDLQVEMSVGTSSQASRPTDFLRLAGTPHPHSGRGQRQQNDERGNKWVNV